MIAATAPVVEYVTAATAVFAAPAIEVGRSAPAPAVIATLAPVVKFFAPVPDRSTCASGGRDRAATKGASSCGGLTPSPVEAPQTREVMLGSEDFVRLRTQTAFSPRVLHGGRCARD